MEQINQYLLKSWFEQVRVAVIKAGSRSTRGPANAEDFGFAEILQCIDLLGQTINQLSTAAEKEHERLLSGLREPFLARRNQHKEQLEAWNEIIEGQGRGLSDWLRHLATDVFTIEQALDKYNVPKKRADGHHASLADRFDLFVQLVASQHVLEQLEASKEADPDDRD